MRRILPFVLSFAFIMLLINPVQARVVRVPQMQANIAAGIANAQAGDTVLVADGRYTGQGNTRVSIASRIVVMSENGPRNCTIDCERAEGVYAFDLAANGAQIRGFTITGAMDHAIKVLGARTDWIIRNCTLVRNQNDNNQRVGIRVEGGTGTIFECIFQENITPLSGGCIFITTSSQVVVNSCLFLNNRGLLGGAIIITQSSTPVIRNCFFQGNQATQHGGAICVSVSSNPTINFCTFQNNTSSGYGGGIYKGSASSPVVRNCVFWGNQAPWGNNLGAENNGGAIDIAWCSVEGGVEEAGGWNGDPIFEIAPRFVQGRAPVWGINGLFLHAQCELIDAGSGPSRDFGMDTMTTQVERTFDADDADLGYHYDPDNFSRIGNLSGRVVDAVGNRPIEGVEVTTTFRQTATTNRNGVWIINEALAGQFDITADMPGYNDSTLTEQFLEEDGELEINFALLHPECILSRNRIESVVYLGDSAAVNFNLENTGNGPLNWKAQTRLVGAADVDPWERRASYAVGNVLNETRLQGVVFVDSIFYATGGCREPNYVYRIDRNGAPLDSFPQFGESNYGMRDITWDGELLWSAEDREVQGFTREGEIITRFVGPLNPITCITWDPDRQILWMATTTGQQIRGFSREGNSVDTLRQKSLRV
ncbi:MAG: right-handed parallel beta-helix repeat-containing protein, partial [Calditrichota bacterium]